MVCRIAIVSHGCLHLVAREDWQALVPRMQERTTPGGIHVVVVFNDLRPVPEDLKPFTHGLFHGGELFALYEGWEILDQRSLIFEDEHLGGIRHTHASDGIVARKP